MKPFKIASQMGHECFRFHRNILNMSSFPKLAIDSQLPRPHNGMEQS